MSDTVVLSPSQTDLVQAAFGTGASAVASWRRWREGIDWGAHLPPDAFRLMPAVARNLRRMEADDPLIPRFGGIARQAWVANQQRLLLYQPLLRALAGASVRLAPLSPDWLLVHDASVVVTRDTALACAVHPASVDAATRCLWRAGWRPHPPRPRWRLEGDVLVVGALAWHDSRNPSLALALEWQRGSDDPQGRFPDATWARARPARLANEPVLALDLADALRELLRRPPQGNAFAAAVELLVHLDVARRDGSDAAILPARVPADAAWRCIADELRAIVPRVPQLSDLEGARPASHATPTAQDPGHRGIGARLAAHWIEYRRAWGDGYSLPAALWRLPGYLMAKWQLPSPRRLPIRAWRGFRWEWRDSRARRR